MQFACALAGIVLAQTLILRVKFREYPADYLWAGIKRTKLFGTCVIAAQLLLATFLFLPLLRRIFRSTPETIVQDVALSILGGILVVALASGLERLLSAFFQVDKLDTWALKALVWLQTITHQEVGYRVQRVLQQDNIDWHLQRSGTFFFSGIDTKKAARIVRVAYEIHKLDIAFACRNPKFLDWDVDIYPGYKFYLLAKHLGRRELRTLLHHQPELGEWTGEERRHSRQQSTSFKRCGDDPRCQEAVLKGRDQYQLENRSQDENAMGAAASATSSQQHPHVSEPKKAKKGNPR